MARRAPGREFGSTTQIELRRALDACAEAEHANAANKRDLYVSLMSAFHAHHPEVPRERVGAESRKALRHRMWVRWGKADGRPPSDFDVPYAWWRTVAAEMGFTDPARGRVEPSAGTGTFYKRNSEIAALPLNARLLDALNGLAETVDTARRLARAYDVESAAGAEAVETVIAECLAVRDNARDLVNPSVAVPPNLHSYFLMLLVSTSSLDSLLRSMSEAVKEARWGGRRGLTRKEITNISRPRTARIPKKLEPQTSHAAPWRRFYGAQCPKCENWRCLPVDGPPGQVRCIPCGHRFRAPEAARCPHCQCDLASERGERDPCPNCGGPTRLPASMR